MTTVIDGLTLGERLELVRRRDKLRQVDCAGLFGVSVRLYREWERDERDDAPRVHVAQAGTAAMLTAGEWCWLQRRRAGMRLRDVAEALGLHLKWVHRVEAGEVADASTLVDYWRDR